MDPFSEAAYQEWANSMELQQQQQQQHTVEPNAIWPSANNRISCKPLGNGTGMSSLPDYFPSAIAQGIGSDPMSLSGPCFDDDHTMDNLKVPTNTPTTLMSGAHAASGMSKLMARPSPLPLLIRHVQLNSFTTMLRQQFTASSPTPSPILC